VRVWEAGHAQTVIRVLLHQSTDCAVVAHSVGTRLFLWEMLPERNRPQQINDAVSCF